MAILLTDLAIILCTLAGIAILIWWRNAHALYLCGTLIFALLVLRGKQGTSGVGK